MADSRGLWATCAPQAWRRHLQAKGMSNEWWISEGELGGIWEGIWGHFSWSSPCPA